MDWWNKSGISWKVSDTLRGKKITVEREIIPIAKHGGGSVVMWGCLAASGPGRPTVVNGTSWTSWQRTSGHWLVTESWSKSLVLRQDNDKKTNTRKFISEFRQVKVLTWIWRKCRDLTLRGKFMFKNFPVWVTYNCGKMSENVWLRSVLLSCCHGNF